MFIPSVTSWLLCAVSWLILIGWSRKLQRHDGKWLLLPITDQKWLLGPLQMFFIMFMSLIFILSSVHVQPRSWQHSTDWGLQEILVYQCHVGFALFRQTQSLAGGVVLCVSHQTWQINCNGKTEKFHRLTVLPMQPLSRQVVVPTTNSSKTTKCLCLCANQTNATRVLISELRNS